MAQGKLSNKSKRSQIKLAKMTYDHLLTMKCCKIFNCFVMYERLYLHHRMNVLFLSSSKVLRAACIRFNCQHWSFRMTLGQSFLHYWWKHAHVAELCTYQKSSRDWNQLRSFYRFWIHGEANQGQVGHPRLRLFSSTSSTESSNNRENKWRTVIKHIFHYNWSRDCKKCTRPNLEDSSNGKMPLHTRTLKQLQRKVSTKWKCKMLFNTVYKFLNWANFLQAQIKTTQ